MVSPSTSAMGGTLLGECNLVIQDMVPSRGISVMTMTVRFAEEVVNALCTTANLQATTSGDHRGMTGGC